MDKDYTFNLLNKAKDFIKNQFWVLFVLILFVLIVMFLLPVIRYYGQMQLLEKQNAKIVQQLEKKLFNNTNQVLEALSNTEEVLQTLKREIEPGSYAVTVALETARKIVDADIVYLMNTKGDVIASTYYTENNGEVKSLLTNNYGFRPYFKQAIVGYNHTYAAVGVTTGKRGIYFSAPVYVGHRNYPAGVIVCKLSVDWIDAILRQNDYTSLLLTSEGVVFCSGVDDWLFKSSYELEAEVLNEITDSKQFFKKSISPLPFSIEGKTTLINDEEYFVTSKVIGNTRWKSVTLYSLRSGLNMSRELEDIVYIISSILLLLIIINIILYINIQKRKKAERKLRKKSNDLRTTLRSIGEGVISTGLDGTITGINVIARQITGYSKENALRMPLDKIFYIISSKSKKAIENPALSVIKTGRITDLPSNISLMSKKGKTYPISGTIAPISGDDAKIRGAVIAFRDESEKAENQKQLLQAQKMEIIGSLASGLAHDFNNVLSGISGSASLLQYLFKSGKEITTEILRDNIEVILNCCRRASDIVSQLQTMTYNQEISFTVFDLNQSIKNVIKLAKNTFDKSIEINAQYVRKPAMVNADPTQIEQVILNLLINASQALTTMRESKKKWGGKLQVTLKGIYANSFFAKQFSSAKAGAYWQITVKDDGVGIPVEILNKIFEPFFTTKDSNNGTGLGLSMVKNIIKQHEGFIRIYSEQDVGTTVNVYIPKLTNYEHDKKEMEDFEDLRGSGRVLIFDDEEILRHSAKEMLEACGFTTLLANEADHGIQLYAKEFKSIDLVLLDLSMPKMSGSEVFDKLKEINPDVRVVISSGFKDNNQIKSILDRGAKAFIQKPFMISSFIKTIKKCITNEHPKEDYYEQDK